MTSLSSLVSLVDALRRLPGVGPKTAQRIAYHLLQHDRDGAHAVMDVIATASQRAYKELVYDQPRFASYFRLATPIDVIERLGIGSRPTSRSDSDSLQDIRAIPWVFSWSQARVMLPAWYGFGAAVAKMRDAGRGMAVSGATASGPPPR